MYIQKKADMAIETELKARVADPDLIKAALSVRGKFLHSYIKKDSYWMFPDKPLLRLRIRSEEKSFPGSEPVRAVLVTYKTREFYGEMEVNNEREFSVSDSAVFEEILAQLGMQPDLQKEKQGRAWELDAAKENAPVLAELSLVKELGWFIELEIVDTACDGAALEQKRSRLLAILDELGIARTAIERRSYSELLKQG